MRILVTWGSKRGGTEGIARTIAEQLQREHVDVDAMPAARARLSADHDAVIVGGALYANRWHGAARRFVRRHRRALRRMPTWLFSSGPLDDSAARGSIPPVREVESLMASIGALEHRTFGGRLAADATGFPASAMARKHAGDWRDTVQICGWASQIARELPTARPGAVDRRGGSPWSVFAHATVGWAACAALAGGSLMVATPTTASILHAIAAPMIFAAVSRRYFGRRGAWAPVPTALTFTATAALLDLAVLAGLLEHSLQRFTSLLGSWLPLALIFTSTWVAGVVMSMLPPRPARTTRAIDAGAFHGATGPSASLRRDPAQ